METGATSGKCDGPCLVASKFEEATARAYASAVAEIQQRVLEEIRLTSDALLKDACNSDSRTGVRSCRLIFDSVGFGNETRHRRRSWHGGRGPLR